MGREKENENMQRAEREVKTRDDGSVAAFGSRGAYKG